MPPRVLTPRRIRAVRAGRDLEKFFERAPPEELAAYIRSFSAENRAAIVQMNVQSGERVGIAPRSRSRPTVAELFRRVARYSGVTDVGLPQTRDQIMETFRGLIGPRGGKGSVIAAALWDYLPRERKSTSIAFTPPERVEAAQTLRRLLSQMVRLHLGRPRSGSAPASGRGTRRASATPRAATPRAMTRGGGRGRGPRSKATRKNIPVKGFAVVQSAEKPWVKETNYKRWLGKLRRHTRRVAREGEEKHPMNLCVDSKLCKGDLGIPRKLMPQFNSPRDIRSFTRFIDRKYGIKAVRATRRAGQLRPSQEEIHRERVEDVKDDIKAKKLNPNVPLIVSADGYVIDGHHRWAAYKSHQPRKRLPVLLVKDSARDVLSMAATWGARHHQF